MLVLGLQGSPRRRGNTTYLLNLFMEAAGRMGARTRIIDVPREPVALCKGCGACEKAGRCVSQDVAAEHFFPLLRQADIVVPASPVYFYGVTAQLKGLIDRCQTLWSRKYRLRLTDPGAPVRQGFFLAVGATQGQQLFDGMHLTVRYFYDAIGAKEAGSLTYRSIEHAGDMAQHSTARHEVEAAVQNLLAPLVARTRVAFVGDDDRGAALMAALWMRYLAGKQCDVYFRGRPVDAEGDTAIRTTLADAGIDAGYYIPQPFDAASDTVDRIVTIGEGAQQAFPAADNWAIPPDGSTADLCSAVESQVRRLIGDLTAATTI